MRRKPNGIRPPNIGLCVRIHPEPRRCAPAISGGLQVQKHRLDDLPASKVNVTYLQEILLRLRYSING